MSENVTRNHFPYWMEVEVRWGDMDPQGHVNNAVYFTYCESARIALVRELGIRGKIAGPHGPVLVSTACDFKREVVYPATLDIGVRVEEIGRRSFAMRYGLFLRGTSDLVAVASSVNAWVDYSEGRSIPLPDEVRAALERYQLPK